MLITYIALFVIHILVLIPIVYAWICGIDDMNKKHPDYKGEDFLN
jgi:hypothetical protein